MTTTHQGQAVRLTIHNADNLDTLRRLAAEGARFDLVELDGPYGAGLEGWDVLTDAEYVAHYAERLTLVREVLQPWGVVFLFGYPEMVALVRAWAAQSGARVVVGVIAVGRPVARMLDTGWTLEVTRCCCAEGHPGAASKLYAAAWRACQALGYKRLITYTLKSEEGASLRGAGWRCIGGRQVMAPRKPPARG